MQDVMKRMHEAVKEIAATNDGKTVLISTHLINDVERIFNSVLMIGEGRVKLDASMDKIRNGDKSVEEIFKEVFSVDWSF